jgi:hypothetical protein
MMTKPMPAAEALRMQAVASTPTVRIIAFLTRRVYVWQIPAQRPTETEN